jgi:hypothetical protein
MAVTGDFCQNWKRSKGFLAPSQTTAISIDEDDTNTIQTESFPFPFVTLLHPQYNIVKVDTHL